MARCKEFEPDEALQKALDLFWLQGFNGASIQEVVDCMGVSRSSLYDTFGDKKRIYLQSLQKRLCSGSTAFVAFTQAAPKALDAIRQLLERTATEGMQDNQKKGCFMVNAAVEMAASDPEVRQIVNQNRLNVETALTALISRGQAAGEIRSGADPRSLARFVFNNFTGMNVAAKFVEDRQVYEDIIENVVAALT